MAPRRKSTSSPLGEAVQEAVQTIGLDIAKTTMDAGEAFRKTRNALNESANHLAADLQDDSAQAIEGLKTQMRTHPLTYLAVAVGVGFAIGFLTRRH